MTKICIALGFCLLVIISVSSAQAQNQAEGQKLYTAYCTSCHGDKGKGDGVAAGSLPVKPQDHTNGAVMNKMTDQALADVISKGGGATGKSSFMPAWGSSLNEKQVRDIVAYIRSLAVPPYKQ
ncbi:MAG TPA: cytochrome c [Candidatus Binatia bacterium]|nr:cytochrome c [Candidatus Binatia bacterium]